jgi:hypothetical protein
MHTNTTIQDYRLSEHERQYKQACLSEYKWNAAVSGALWFAVSTAFTGWYAFRAGYPVSGATAIFTGGVNVMLVVAVVAAIATFLAKQRKDTLRRDVAMMNIDADAWARHVEASLAEDRARIRANGWVWTAVAILANVLFTVVLVSFW